MLSCKDFVEHSHEYLEDSSSMSLGKRLSYGMHRLMCIHCRRFLRQYSLVSSTSPLLKGEPPTEQQIKASLESLNSDGTNSDQDNR